MSLADAVDELHDCLLLGDDRTNLLADVAANNGVTPSDLEQAFKKIYGIDYLLYWPI